MEIITWLIGGVLAPLFLGGAAYGLSTTPAEGCSPAPRVAGESAASTPNVSRAHCAANASACEPDA